MHKPRCEAQMDHVVDLLAHLICGETTDCAASWGGVRPANDGTTRVEIDAGSKLGFSDMAPRHVTLAEEFHNSAADRIYTPDASLLLQPPQDLLGDEAEFAFVLSDHIRWIGVRKARRRPKSLWIASPGCSLYEVHFRKIYANGSNDYAKRAYALSARGRPVPCVVQGSHGDVNTNLDLLVILASILEDATRTDIIQTTFTDIISCTFSVPQGAHLELFKLREGPLSGSRKRPLLHWVARHLRGASAGLPPINIDSYLRGVSRFSIEGLLVTLEASKLATKGAV